MRYRSFGKLDWKPSALGFGAMRMPVIDGDSMRIDEPEATRMIRTAIEHGVNYVDTAYPYHGGNSEGVVGRALKDGYRGLVKLATKAPVWLFKEQPDFDKYLNEQLQRLQTEQIDFYLLHGLGEARWKEILRLDILQAAERALADGRIAHLGFSFHDRAEVFAPIVDGFSGWTFCQIQYNFMDEETQAGKAGLQYAASKGLAVVVMEPIRGGNLTRNTPKVITDLWDTASVRRTPADWALQWVWNQPEVSLALSGMSTMQQLTENLDSADRSGVGTLSADDLAVIGKVRDTYRALVPIPCTTCRYCMPCEQGVNIPGLFQIYNQAAMFDDWQWGKMAYRMGSKPEERADHCIACRECESKCPQQIEISEWMKKIDAALKETPPAKP